MMGYFNFYENYLTITGHKKDEGFITCRCPFIDNHNNGDQKGAGSAGFDVVTGVFNCNVCGAFHPYTFLRKLFPDQNPVALGSAVSSFKREHNLVERNDTFIASRLVNPKFKTIYEKAGSDLRNNKLAREYAESRGLSIEVLHKAGIRYIDGSFTNWKRDSLVFPYFAGNTICGLRYRDMDGNKSGEPGCYFTLFGAETLTEETNTVILVEGETDRLSLLQDVKDVPVLSSPTGAFRAEWVRIFSGIDNIICIPQADTTGSKMEHEVLKYLNGRSTIIHLPWRRDDIGKDIVEWRITHNIDELLHRIDIIVSKHKSYIVQGAKLKTLADEINEGEYYISNLAQKQSIMIVAGNQKSFKTWLALELVRTIISNDEKFLGIDEFKSTKLKPNVLFIEEEGNVKRLFDRVTSVLKDTEWEKRTFWGHHINLKLDNEEHVARLSKFIHEHNIGVLVADPMQRLHSLDEDNATAMGAFWDVLHTLTTEFPDLFIVVIHHFSKKRDFTDMWAAIRGSSRSGGEADMGIFVGRLSKSEGLGCKIIIDGRDYDPIRPPGGKEFFKVPFDETTKRLLVDESYALTDKHLVLLNELSQRSDNGWKISDAAEYFGVSIKTVSRWVEKIADSVEITKPSPGNPAKLRMKDG